MSTEIRFVQKLSEDEKHRIHLLEENCKKTKDIHFKLDPQSFVDEDDCVSHVLHETDSVLTGYAAINFFTGEEMECTIVVNESKMIFMELYKAVVKRAKEKGIDRVLFIIDRNDKLSNGWVKDLSLCFSNTEYRMVFNEARFKPSKRSDIAIQDAAGSDAKVISCLENCDSVETPNNDGEKEPESSDIKNVKIARMNNEVIGKIRVDDIDGTVGLYGFIVCPSRRGEGLGRGILNNVIKSITEKDYKIIYLEVDSENHPALNLYKSIGFETHAAFDYYVYTA